jgi:Kef-type K+ transport system membrane component KefB
VLTFNSLAVVAVAAFVAPVVANLVQHVVPIPVPVVEIVLGVLIGPQVLGWAKIDEPVQVLALLGTAYVLFLAGFELDLRSFRSEVLGAPGLAYVASLGVGVVAGIVLDRTNLVADARLAAILLTASSLVLITPVLREAQQIASPLGRVAMGLASIAEITSVALLSLLFTKESGDTSTRVALVVGFVVLIVVAGLSLSRAAGLRPVERLFARLGDGTSQLRIRGAIMMIALLVVLAEQVGLEAILGAIIAGALVGALDRGYLRTHVIFRTKLDAIGFGFLGPIFFIWSGMSMDITALRDQPSRIALIPLLLVLLLATHVVVVPILRRSVGTRSAVAVAILASTPSLPFVVAASAIGRDLNLITDATSAALVASAALAALIFPAVALTLVPPSATPVPLAEVVVDDPLVDGLAAEQFVNHAEAVDGPSGNGDPLEPLADRQPEKDELRHRDV